MSRRWTIVLAAIAGLVLLSGFITYRLLYTEQGLNLLLGRMQGLAGISIEIRGAKGTLAGPFSADKLIVDLEAVRVEASGLEMDPDLGRLFSGQIVVDGLRVSAIEVALKPTTAREPGDPQFLPRFLSVALPSFELNDAGLTLASGKRFAIAQLSGQLDLTHALLRLEQVKIDDPAGHLEGELALRATEPFGLDARLEGRWQAPDEQSYEFAASVRGDLDLLVTEAELAAPAQLSFAGNLLTLTDDPRVVGTLRITDFDGTPWLQPGAMPATSGSLAIVASTRSIGIDGTLASALFGEGQFRLQGSGRVLEQKFEIAGLRAWLPRMGSEFLAWGSIDWGQSAPTLALEGEWTALRWPLDGPPQVRSAAGFYQFSGSMPYDFETEMVVSAAGVEDAGLQISGTIDRSSVTLSKVQSQLLNGRARGLGRLSWKDGGSWQAQLSGKSLDIGEIRPDLQGQLSFAARLNGQGLTATSPWQAAIDELSGSLLGRSLTGRGRISHSAGIYELDAIRLSSGDSIIDVNGRLGPEIELDWQADLVTLSLLSPDIQGRLESSGSVRGARSRPEVQTKLKASNFSYGSLNFESLDLDADIDLSDGRTSRINARIADAAAGALAVESLELIAGGHLAEHQLSVSVRSPGSIDGRILGFRAALEAAGEMNLERRRWIGTLSSVEALFEDGDASLIEPVDIEISPDRMSATPLCLETGEARLCTEGEWNRAPESWRAIYSVQDWPLRRLLRSMLGWQEFDGRIQASGWIAKEAGSDWVGGTTVVLDDPTLDIPRNKFRSERIDLGTGRLDVFAEAEEIRATVALQVTEGTDIDAQVVADRRYGQPLALAPLNGQLKGQSSALTALPLFVPEIDRSAGRLDARLQVAGTLGQPQFSGEFNIADGEFELYRTNLALSDVNLGGRVAGGELRFSGTGQTREGPLELSGNFSWPEGVMTGSMRLKGERLLVADTPEYRVIASPDLILTAGTGGFEVTGELQIPAARISPRDLSTTVTTSPDERVVGIDAEESGPSTAERVTSRVTVMLGDNVKVNSMGLKADLGGEVIVSTKPGDVARGNGSINVLRGEYRAFGQDVKITRGRITYRNTPLSDPDIDLVAQREITAEDVIVSISVRGRLADPFVTLSSQPSMPSNEALSYLLTGRSINSLQSNEASSVNQAANDLAISGGALLLGGIGQRVGLDDVTVERGSNDQTEVVLGKALSPRLYVSYGISIAEAINTIKLRYTINENWSGIIEAGLNQAADLEYRVER